MLQRYRPTKFKMQQSYGNLMLSNSTATVNKTSVTVKSKVKFKSAKYKVQRQQERDQHGITTLTKERRQRFC